MAIQRDSYLLGLGCGAILMGVVSLILYATGGDGRIVFDFLNISLCISFTAVVFITRQRIGAKEAPLLPMPEPNTAKDSSLVDEELGEDANSQTDTAST